MAETLDPETIHERRERVFLILAGLFLGSLAMLNILGVSRFITLFRVGEGGEAWVFAVAVGVLPYPLTFLCTDFISELYGRRRANRVVWVGLLVNLWVILVLWLGGVLPEVPPMNPETGLPELPVDPETGRIAEPGAGAEWAFYKVRDLAFGAVAASMLAYLLAQFCDVYLFHFWKRLTGGRHLWLRNNGSTLLSQLVDTAAVILVTHYYAGALPVDPAGSIPAQLGVFILTGYAFKVAAAAIDTLPFYLGVRWLGRYLRIEPAREHRADAEEIALAMTMPGEEGGRQRPPRSDI